MPYTQDILDESLETVREESEAIGPATESTPLLLIAHENASNSQDRPYLFAIYSVVMCVLCFATIMTVVPLLEVYRYIICQDYYSDSKDAHLISLIRQFKNGTSHDLCSVDEISRRVARYQGLSDTFDAIPGMAMVLFYGWLSDKYGRKAPMITVSTGLLFARLWTLFVLQHAGEWSINVLLLSPIISGLSGSTPAVRMAIFSIACDCFTATGAGRLVSMSWLLAGISLVGAAGPAVGSFLLQRNVWLPLYAEVGCEVLCLVVILFLPETHQHLKQQEQLVRGDPTLTNDPGAIGKLTLLQKLTLTAEDTVQAVKNSLSSLGIFGRGRNFIVLAIVSVLVSAFARGPIIVVQLINHKFKWSMVKAGYFYSAVSAGRIFVLMLVFPVATKWGLKRLSPRRWDKLVIEVCLGMDALAYMIYGIAATTTTLSLAAVFQALATPAGTSLRVLISTLVPTEESGTLFAAFGLVEAFGDLIGNQGMAWIYAATLSTHAGIVCFVIAVGYALTVMIMPLLRVKDLEVDAPNEAAA